jgi:hypothetical protein
LNSNTLLFYSCCYEPYFYIQSYFAE